ncbi:MAG: FHA domain-containing protein [Actinomycetaceae bacterium]|nr:FHA domain-containing protein [Actinomycetaceae bacterium]MDY5854385.1 FHA domain-containing protein [Arcanobacterium sp.]
MSALLITLLRFGFLALLWIFVLIVVGTVRHDVFGTRVRARITNTSRTSASARSLRRSPRAASNPQNAPQQFSLVVTQGPLTGTRLSLNSGPVMVGRSPDASLVLDDGYASARHARFFRDGERVIIEDLNSTNGTWVGGVQIHEPTVLSIGMPVTIGKTVLEVQE